MSALEQQRALQLKLNGIRGLQRIDTGAFDVEGVRRELPSAFRNAGSEAGRGLRAITNASG